MMAPPLFSSSYSDAPDNHLEWLKMYGSAYSVWCCLGMSWRVWGRVLVSGIILGCQSCFGSLWGLLESWIHAEFSSAEANPPFCYNTEMQDFFHLIILRHQNTKTAAYMLSKNHWVRPFFAFLGSSERYFLSQLLLITLYNMISFKQ